ncbi:hypothetical protein D9613_012210 [Agrocybe pediades]|uniref:Uncharacterized protein n=1 Tax=Agrocybe pediades TaxID=84607 RepID=A0A8H4R511_9AGAR|nr:hypothetical protein D9613_012210 [Agrocybe pediades]
MPNPPSIPNPSNNTRPYPPQRKPSPPKKKSIRPSANPSTQPTPENPPNSTQILPTPSGDTNAIQNRHKFAHLEEGRGGDVIDDELVVYTCLFSVVCLVTCLAAALAGAGPASGGAPLRLHAQVGYWVVLFSDERYETYLFN